MFLRTPYNYDTDEASHASGLECKDPSLAQQHMADECDINQILKKFGVTGQLPVVEIPPTFGDFTGVSDYQSALNQVMTMDETFMSLPADLRVRFNHDPVELLNFLDNPQNKTEAIQLGLVNGQPVAEPVVAVPTPKTDE